MSCLCARGYSHAAGPKLKIIIVSILSFGVSFVGMVIFVELPAVHPPVAQMGVLH
jgi:hypothetical protein